MKVYTSQEYKSMSERFNKMSFTAKIILIKQNKELFKLEFDGDCFWLRLNDNEAMKREDDMLFDFPQNLSFEQMRDIFSLFDLTIFPAK